MELNLLRNIAFLTHKLLTLIFASDKISLELKSSFLNVAEQIQKELENF